MLHRWAIFHGTQKTDFFDIFDRCCWPLWMSTQKHWPEFNRFSAKADLNVNDVYCSKARRADSAGLIAANLIKPRPFLFMSAPSVFGMGVLRVSNAKQADYSGVR